MPEEVVCGVRQVGDAGEPGESRIPAAGVGARRRIGEVDLVLFENPLLAIHSDLCLFLRVHELQRLPLLGALKRSKHASLGFFGFFVGRPHRRDEAATDKILEPGTGDKATPLLAVASVFFAVALAFAVVGRGTVVDEEGLEELFDHREIGCGTLKMCCEASGGLFVCAVERVEIIEDVVHTCRERSQPPNAACSRRDHE